MMRTTRQAATGTVAPSPGIGALTQIPATIPPVPGGMDQGERDMPRRSEPIPAVLDIRRGEDK